jgi:hypothetical protein
LPLPTARNADDAQIVGTRFVETLMQAVDEDAVRQLVEERAAVIRGASRWSKAASDRRPKSKDQLAIASAASGGHICSAAEFAAAVRG